MFLPCKRTGTFSVSSLGYSPHSKRACTQPASETDWTGAVSQRTSGVRQAAPSVPELGKKKTWMRAPFYRWGNPGPSGPACWAGCKMKHSAGPLACPPFQSLYPLQSQCSGLTEVMTMLCDPGLVTTGSVPQFPPWFKKRGE